MATLKELCATIPTSVLKMQEAHEHKMVMREVARRTALSYAQRMKDLKDEWHVYDKCKQSRPQKGKYKNGYSREEAGTQGTIVAGIRAGRYTVVTCKTKRYN